jgi:hypothetical protein
MQSVNRRSKQWLYKPTAISFLHENLYYAGNKFCKKIYQPSLKILINKKASTIRSCSHTYFFHLYDEFYMFKNERLDSLE